jgi:hypothetical protein
MRDKTNKNANKLRGLQSASETYRATTAAADEAIAEFCEVERVARLAQQIPIAVISRMPDTVPKPHFFSFNSNLGNKTRITVGRWGW